MDRDACLAWYLRNRRRSRQWFDLVSPAAYRARPISLRHPIIFYEGHVVAFSVNTLLKRGLGHPGLNAAFDTLFERGIDPLDEPVGTGTSWPERAEVVAYAAAAETAVRDALTHADITRADHPVLRDGLAVYMVLEHEAMHHETLLYMFQRLAYDEKRPPADACPIVGGRPPRPARVRVPAGTATLGAEPGSIPFGWDNEFPRWTTFVPAFTIDVYNVTNQDYCDFVDAGGYAIPDYWKPDDWTWRVRHGLQHPVFWTHRDGRWFWRALFEEVPLPPAWPVYVSHAEASAYARWKGARLPTEAEYHRAAFATSSGVERAHPWGDEPPDRTRGNFDLQHWDPLPVGSLPAGASAWGIHDLVGNGWEWTSTVFDGFPGFAPTVAYPGYSADFFDGQHYVLKGASPATASELVRRSWRNWFQPRYPYPYAGFRCVTS
jgi:ergothioneine biosynthesis protein EgtB